MQIEFYKDIYGARRAKCPLGFEIVGSYLEEEIQGSIEYGLMLIELINTIQAGKQAFWEGTGNAHTLTLTANTAKIFNEFSEDLAPCELRLEEFKEACVIWLSAIANLS